MKRLFAIFVILALTGPAHAWNDRGHMMVAAIAFDQLTPNTKTRVAQLLELNKYPVNGDSTGVTAANSAKATFMKAATAADAIKSGAGFKDDGDDAGTAAHPDLNVGFSDKLMHKYWHFADTFFFAPGASGTLPTMPAVNAQERIGLFRKTLASTASNSLKAYDLVWLLHIVGDVHQPLHDVSRVTADRPKGDRGGNDVKLCLTSPTSCRTKLHAFWDDAAGTGDKVVTILKAACELEYTDAADRTACESGKITKPPVRPDGSSITDEASWVKEGLQTAQKDAYKSPPIGNTAGNFPVDQAYEDNAHSIAQTKVLLAGARLADLLNSSLK